LRRYDAVVLERRREATDTQPDKSGG